MSEPAFDYKTEFHDAVTDLIAEVISDRGERMAAVHALTEAYFDSVGVAPDGREMKRLSDYILREELTDPSPHKIAHTEYPFMSEIQLERRRFGRRGTGDTNMFGETYINGGDDESREYHSRPGVYLATDGKDYRKPIRRTRTIEELIYIDENATIRDEKRAEKYRLETTPGPVTYGASEPFTQCAGIGAKWRAFAMSGREEIVTTEEAEITKKSVA